jgi:glycosyltransferase involved in cell wall biosynthesis
MKVLFLMFAFPNMDESFNMYTSLVEEFSVQGHEVFVAAPLNRKGETGIYTEKSINILRINTLPLKNVPVYIKGISNILLPIQYYFALKKYFRRHKFDLIIVPTPPVTFSGITARLKKQHNAAVYLILRDIFPQNAVDLGMIRKGGFIYRYFRKKEKKLYKTADHIGCMSEGNIEYLLAHDPFIKKEKLHILPNFQKLNTSYPGKDLEIKAKYGLENKYIVIFGGNMGKPQQLENVLALAKGCMKYPEVIFLLLGEGVQASRIGEACKLNKIANIKLISTVAKDEYQKLVSISDVGLISLHSCFTIPNIPSKTLDYFNLGIPVLASIDSATDYRRLLDETHTGLWSYAGDTESFLKNFERLYSDSELRRVMGINGRKFFENYLTPGRAYNTITSKTGNK